MASKTNEMIVRPLEAADLEAVIAIDTATAGRARNGFFERRFAAAAKDPKRFVYVGAADNGALKGFALVRILAGEYGTADEIAVLDAIGVEPAAQGQGIGQALLTRIDEAMREKNIREVRTQTDWTSHELLGFLEAAGFELAPWLVLSRDVSHPADW
ncbi:MAG: GNAT family N-acetyltransferase [Hyphomicrobiales bacterium]|nr:GNAT family N-acetyltransferase [Hyphomicrobiales bacterium]